MTIKYIILYYFILFYYQQPGDAKKPYLAQYSGVVLEVAPVKASYATIKTNMPTKNRLNPLKANLNAFLT
jgi:hypothetical protein